MRKLIIALTCAAALGATVTGAYYATLPARSADDLVSDYVDDYTIGEFRARCGSVTATPQGRIDYEFCMGYVRGVVDA